MMFAYFKKARASLNRWAEHMPGGKVWSTDALLALDAGSASTGYMMRILYPLSAFASSSTLAYTAVTENPNGLFFGAFWVGCTLWGTKKIKDALRSYETFAHYMTRDGCYESCYFTYEDKRRLDGLAELWQRRNDPLKIDTEYFEVEDIPKRAGLRQKLPESRTAKNE